MRSVRRWHGVEMTLAACVACLPLGALASQAQHERHEHAHSAGKLPVLKQGQKWPTDAPLREGMEAIRQALMGSQAQISRDELSAQDYDKLATQIDTSLAKIVANCKLPAASDAAFHSMVLAELNHSTELMRRSPKLQIRKAGAMAAMQTLRNYGQYFDHPGWQMNSPQSP